MASKKIFVGGLSHETSEADFNAYFGARAAAYTDRPPFLFYYALSLI